MRQELILEAVEQRHVPLEANAETGIAISARRKVAEEENRQIDFAARREMTKHRRLILNRIADQARDAVAAFHLMQSARRATRMRILSIAIRG